VPCGEVFLALLSSALAPFVAPMSTRGDGQSRMLRTWHTRRRMRLYRQAGWTCAHATRPPESGDRVLYAEVLTRHLPAFTEGTGRLLDLAGKASRMCRTEIAETTRQACLPPHGKAVWRMIAAAAAPASMNAEHPTALSRFVRCLPAARPAAKPMSSPVGGRHCL